jgi:hypothetical protein
VDFRKFISNYLIRNTTEHLNIPEISAWPYAVQLLNVLFENLTLYCINPTCHPARRKCQYNVGMLKHQGSHSRKWDKFGNGDQCFHIFCTTPSPSPLHSSVLFSLLHPGSYDFLPLNSPSLWFAWNICDSMRMWIIYEKYCHTPSERNIKEITPYMPVVLSIAPEPHGGV